MTATQAGKPPGQRPLIGWLWQIASVLAALLMVLLLQSLRSRWSAGDIPVVVVGPMIGILFAGPWWLYKQGQRHFAGAAGAAMAADPRPPVVYLRSFAAEETIGEEEMALARVLGAVGPFVAVGSPGDRLPPLGASRAYLPGDDWKEFVTGLVQRSRLVVVLAGATPGLGWELALCRKELEPSKLIFVVARDEAAYAAFRTLAQPAGFELPACPPQPDSPIGGTIYAFVTFGDDWEPKIDILRYGVLDAKSPFDAAVSVLRLGLSDLLKPRGIDLGAAQASTHTSIRQHWRLAIIAAAVLILWQLSEALGLRLPY